jgi:hypothetical protein
MADVSKSYYNITFGTDTDKNRNLRINNGNLEAEQTAVSYNLNKLTDCGVLDLPGEYEVTRIKSAEKVLQETETII